MRSMVDRYSKLLPAVMAVILGGCTQLGVSLANLPIKFSDMEIKKEITYGNEDWQKLDIYIPKRAKVEKLPVITFFYGGRWTDGSKDMYAFVGHAFAKEGYIVVIADYSKYPNVKFPSFVEDGAKAVAWIHNNIDKHGGDANNLFISGHSSGAHIGALVVADERYLQAEGKNNSIIKAFAGLAGPYDFIPQADDLKDIFGPPTNYPLMTVTNFIDGNEPPMLLLWGEDDDAVWERNIKLLGEKIEKENGLYEIKMYPGVDHVGVISGLIWFLRGQPPILKDITNFFESNRK